MSNHGKNSERKSYTEKPVETRAQLTNTLWWGEALSGLGSAIGVLNTVDGLVRQAAPSEITLMGFFTLLCALFFLLFRAGRLVLKD